MNLNIKTHVTSNSSLILRRIKGSIKKLGANYAFQKVCLYSCANNHLITATTSDESGNYQFELSSAAPVYIVALDHQQQFNAVIQDNVVPK